MSKTKKFRFNPETLDYEYIGKSIQRTVKRVGSFLIWTFVVAIIYYSVYSLFFDTYFEYSIKRENQILAEHLTDINDQYKNLNEVIMNISKRDTNIYSVIFETKPLDNVLVTEQLSTKHELLHTKTIEELVLLAESKIQKLTGKLQSQSEFANNFKHLMALKQDEIQFIPTIVPLKNLNMNAVGASIGEKINPIHKSLFVHKGIDFAVPVGSEVIVTASGTVKDIISRKFSTGTEIIIDHGNDYETRYLYLNEAFVKKRAKVCQGDVIGKVGNIGVTVPHLHYEVRMGGKIADPLNYFFMTLSPKDAILFAKISLNRGQSLD
ncbi:MAG: M23 family metallopeptidase [Prevotellaceae bacterium]|jgi:murein DD-endopeptidase MepM/ murein hydrolase activator NlpD|nr:M23 family metallopeptidase [Prevotellaceae bacterium]